MRKLILAAALLSLVAVSCELQVNLVLDIAEDASGTVAAEIAVDDEMLALLSQEGDPADQIFDGAAASGFDDATFSERKEGEFTYYTVELPFDDVAEIDEFLQGDATPLNGTFDIVATEDEISVNAVSQNTDEAFESQGLEGFDASALETFFSANVRVRLPGDVTSNADRILEDGTLEWDLPLTGEDIVIEATADLGGGGSFPWLVVVLVAAAGAVVLAIGLRMRAGSGPGDEGPAETEPAPAPPEPVPAPE